ncbi:MAG: hypothetical protein HY927_17255 [Elusimicrobia bacterium]|nr:hypothetical protein [Elusimicrobiota bacterium]
MRIALEFLVNFTQGIVYVVGATVMLVSPVIFLPEFKRNVVSFLQGALAATIAGVVIYLASALLVIPFHDVVGLRPQGWSFAVDSPRAFGLAWLVVLCIANRAMAGAYRRAARLQKLGPRLGLLGAVVALAFSLVWAGALIMPTFSGGSGLGH